MQQTPVIFAFSPCSGSRYSIDPDMPDPRNINAWMGHCGGTDPYCQQGCSPKCANYTYMTGIEAVDACKDPSADTLVGNFGNRGGNQPRVKQREVQEAMRKVQERHAQGGTQTSLPQHQVRFQGRIPATFETSGMVNPSTVASTSSGLTASDANGSLNSMPRDMVSSTPRTAPGCAVEDRDEDADAEYEVEELQRCRMGAARRPPCPVQRLRSWEPPT